jgi:DNA-binding FrmR family transcriptional regulator
MTPKPIKTKGEILTQCACAAPDSPGAMGPGRLAVAVDPAIKSSTLRRLARIEGQVRGLANMVENERYCADILVQIASVQEALRGVSRQLMRNHLQHCATTAIRKDDPSASAMYDEILDLVYRHAR